MVEDVTDDMRRRLGDELERAIGKIATVYEIDTRLVSQTMGILSTNLVAAYTGGRRMPHHQIGYDVVAGSEKIEVKSRFQEEILRPPSFNIRNSSRVSSLVYFLVWEYPWEG